MKWRTYSRYRNSDIKWLGEIPAHWGILKLKHMASVRFSSVDKRAEEGEKPVRLCNYVDVYYNNYITPDLSFMEATASQAETSKFMLRMGDVIVTKDSESWDDIAVAAYVPLDLDDVLCGYHLAQIRPNTAVVVGEYLFRSFCASGINDQFKVAANGITRYGLGKYWLDNSFFPVPPMNEQHAITSFLHRETAKIDALTAKKEQLIALLQEKRSALITRAVTKGLDPNVAMKDFGVEWLGEIPEHWNIQKLKHMTSVRLSNVDKKKEEGEQAVRLCNYLDVYYKDYITPDLSFMEATASQAETSKFMLRMGDVIVTKDSESWDDIAVAAYVPLDLDDVLCGYHLAQIRPNTAVVVGEYLFRSFCASGINDQFKVAANGITRYSLGKYWLDNSFFPVPPMNEQNAITSFLDRETAKIDNLIAKIREGINHLKEYRNTLISAAVTGKIDVREKGA